jgi:hypothetical protein
MPPPKSGSKCCVDGCRNSCYNSPGTQFYRFPKIAWKLEQKNKWIEAIKRVNKYGWEPGLSSRVCSRHFIGNQKSDHPLSPNFIPTIFPTDEPKQSTSADCAVTQEETAGEYTSDMDVGRLIESTQMDQAKELPGLPTENPSVAWKLFNAFVFDDQISVTEDELVSYATDDLKLNLNELPGDMRDHLTVILLAYMNVWPGWHYKDDFLAGKFKKEVYFERFQKFMLYKMKSTVQGTYASAMKGLENQVVNSTKFNTPIKSEPEFSPYAISIQCPPVMLNTIVFSNVGEDVIMKQHLGSEWEDLSTTQLLNWPHVEVTFRTQDICFVRRQATEFVRYLNFLPHESNKTSQSIIEHVETLRSYGRQKNCYSYNFLEEYMKVYMEALKSTTRVSAQKLEEIQTILSQFLEDVRYIDVNNSIATNTVVLFRLSPLPFIRNKKLVRNNDREGDEARVGYCEIITPKIELVLLYFRAEQKDTPVLSFEYTDTIKASQNASTILPHISYKCTYCRQEYIGQNSKKTMFDHLKNEHKMEQHVRCTLCKKQFDVLNLAACRWKHKCHQ